MTISMQKQKLVRFFEVFAHIPHVLNLLEIVEHLCIWQDQPLCPENVLNALQAISGTYRRQLDKVKP